MGGNEQSSNIVHVYNHIISSGIGSSEKEVTLRVILNIANGEQDNETKMMELLHANNLMRYLFCSHFLICFSLVDKGGETRLTCIGDVSGQNINDFCACVRSFCVIR